MTMSYTVRQAAKAGIAKTMLDATAKLLKVTRHEADPDDRVYYMVSSPPGEFILGNHKLPPPHQAVTLRPDRPTFYDGQVESPDGMVQVRVAAILLDYGDPTQQRQMMVQVAKSRVSREALARDILIDTVLPLSLPAVASVSSLGETATA